MEDMIYRQEALEGLYDVFFDNELSAAYPKEADKVLDVIRKLPSAQPECPEWVRKVELMHSKALKMPYIKKPMAWALYQVWKEYDNE